MNASDLKLNEISPVSSIKEILEIAVREDGNKHAFEFKNHSNEVVGVTYKDFFETTKHLGTALSTINLLENQCDPMKEVV